MESIIPQSNEFLNVEAMSLGVGDVLKYVLGGIRDSEVVNVVLSESIHNSLNIVNDSGYLIIEKKEEQLLTLDYPNREVMNSLSSMYLKLIYRVEGYALLDN